MVLDELLVALIENIRMLNTSVVVLSDELRRWSHNDHRSEVAEWASQKLQDPRFITADTRESTESLSAVERRSILKALVQTNGNTLRAARVLGIGRTTLYRKLRAYRQAEASSRTRGERNREMPSC
jgi:transcriptional regulator of acetoin/glycerol metabolism